METVALLLGLGYHMDGSEGPKLVKNGKLCNVRMNKTRRIGEHMGLSLFSFVIRPGGCNHLYFFLLLPSGLDLLSDLYVP